jgi:hypothetical protein
VEVHTQSVRSMEHDNERVLPACALVSSHVPSTLLVAAAARALIDFPELSAEDVAKKAMKIASEMCVYTNQEFLVETLETKEKEEES